MTLSNPAQYISGRTVQEQMNSLIDYVDQRAGDVALDAIASDVAQVHQDMLDADADAAAAAASAAAAAGTLANAVKKTGEASQSIAGDIAVSGDLSVSGDAGVQGQLSVLGGCDLRAPVKIPVTPTNNDDAASKKYVDDSLDNYAPMVRTTGDQNITGNKNRTGNAPSNSGFSPYGWLLKWSNCDVTQVPTSNQFAYFPCIVDQNGVLVGGIRIQNSSTNTISFALFVTKRDGTTRASKTLGTYDFSTDTWS